MNPKKHRHHYLFLLFAILLAACGQGPINIKLPGQNNLPSPSIDLKPCMLGNISAQCGSLRVYEDREARRGRKINVQIAIIKAQSPNPAPDPIFYLAGGPGDSAIEDAHRQQFPYDLSYTHDLVFVDQRGTGGSNQKIIPSDSPDLTGLTPEQADAKAKAWASKVLRKLKMEPRFYTTSEAMDDLDDVREALGYDKINLVGYSYGATAAQYYLRQHEEYVRTMTLGGGSLLDVPVFELWAQNSQRAMDLILERCLADPACEAAFPNLKAEFKDLFARLEAQPVTENLPTGADGQTENVTFTPDFFAAIVRLMTKDAKDHSRLPLLIRRAYQDNDWKGFVQFYADGGGPEWWGDLVMAHVIRCSEKWASFDPAEVARLSDGSYLAGWDTRLAQNQAFSCNYTPRGVTPEGLDPQPGSDVPVLIFNGEVDPIDPPENMSGAKALWPNSLSLVGPYQSHSLSDMFVISCWFSILTEFIEDGSAENLQTECMENIKPPAFYTDN